VDNDIRREERYLAAGWTQVRISKRHMKNGAREAVAKIREALVQAGWRP
jgi:very-short-patch-repair endonuclease